MGFLDTLFQFSRAIQGQNKIYAATRAKAERNRKDNVSPHNRSSYSGVQKSSSGGSKSSDNSKSSGGSSGSSSSNSSGSSESAKPKKPSDYSDPERNAKLKGLLAKNLRGEDLGKTSSISDSSKIGNAVNDATKEQEGANNIIVMTKNDNLTHNYFHFFECWWDANNCLSGVKIKMPKSETENTKYWINYKGEVLIYMGNNINSNNVESKDKDGKVNNDKYWDLKGLYPFFQGTVTRIKEHQDELEIHIDSIGRRFKAKIPDEFRQSYINNQNVRDAFQAICEFLGVYYICPPKTEIEDEEEEEESAETDGTENDVDKKVDKENQLATKAANAIKKKQKAISKSSSSKKKTKKGTDTIETIGAKTGEETEEGEEEEGETTDTTEETGDLQTNGYADISFDAGGSIVHGSAVVETSPDMAQTLLNMTENPLLRGNYDEEGNEYIIEDVGKLLRGEMFEELHSSVMDYGAITIEPKTATTSDMSTVGGVTGDANGENGEENGGSGSGSGSNSGGSATYSLQARDQKNKNGWYGGQLYENGKIVLYSNYINSLSPAQAKAKYAQKGVYTSSTYNKLQLRALGRRV